MQKDQSFWEKIKNKKNPILSLAPLAGYTDSAFRRICKEFGADVVYSEMASATALVYNPKKTLEILYSDNFEQPYVVQLFGSNPEHFAQAAKLLTDKKAVTKILGTDADKYLIPSGIDINFGCPVPKVAKQKAGAELFKDLKLSREVILAVINNSSIPVSVKVRTKVGEVDLFQFLKNISDLDVSAIMIHGRSFKQGFTGEIDYEVIKKSRDYFGGVVLANGGVTDGENARKTLELTGADGVGIGRGALGRPWIFHEIRKFLAASGEIKSNICKVSEIKSENIFEIILKHAELVNELKGERGIVEMRAHLCYYTRNMQNAKALREKFVKAENLKDIVKILNKK